MNFFATSAAPPCLALRSCLSEKILKGGFQRRLQSFTGSTLSGFPQTHDIRRQYTFGPDQIRLVALIFFSFLCIKLEYQSSSVLTVVEIEAPIRLFVPFTVLGLLLQK